jgi:penicillin-binding protein 1A
VNSSYLRWLRRAALGVVSLILLVGFALACTFVYLAPALPTAETMRTKDLARPMQVLTRNGELVSTFGEERRIPVRYEDIPQMVWRAVLAAEDDRFFEHHGLDWMGLMRALVTNVTSGGASQGGSTITQQTVKYMFLTLDKTLRRKASELFLTYRMERDFTKEQILTTYLNVIPYGQRARGIAAAAETYYGKRLQDLTVAQAATLAGISQRPSVQNPITNPDAAKARRAYVLRRMKELGHIDEATAAAAAREPVASRGFALLSDCEADYVAELGRQKLVELFGERAVNEGYKVFTTLDCRMQAAANSALRLGLLENYDRKHGYRGRLGKVDLSSAPTAEELEEKLEKFRSVNVLLPAIVTRVADTSAEVFITEKGTAQIKWDGMSWARRTTNSGLGPAPTKATDVLKRGDVIYVTAGANGIAQLAQMPQAQGALIAMDPKDGEILAMVGGFDFHINAFNRVTQAKRQPGSGFKPFLYSAALENGFTPATIILDMPVVVDRSSADEEDWKPENSDGKFLGPMRLREALVRSRNAVSIRILQEIGIDALRVHAAKFGFDPASIPRTDSVALGTQSVNPLQMATGYSVFANGGFKVDYHLITRIEDAKGKVVYEEKPKIACAACEVPDAPGSNSVPEDRRAPRVLSAQNAWLMSDIMHDVATRGTGRRTQELGRDDLAGKTGTTQSARDNWFNGFNSNLVASVWIGYDDDRTLGEKEEGASTAVPIWNLFMAEALKGTPSARMPRPEGLIDVRISATTGAPLGNPLDPDGITEIFMADHQTVQPGANEGTTPGTSTAAGPKPASTGSNEVVF